jgi:hypothetical protein
MHTEEVLILAMTKMLSGICAAGLTRHRGPDGRLRWLRPVREFGSVLPGDMMDGDGRMIKCWDVVELAVVKPCPQPPHVEDWITDFVRHPPRVLRRLEDDRRAAFLAKHAHRSASFMIRQARCSLCLVKPETVTTRFTLDGYSGKYQAKMQVTLPGNGQAKQGRMPEYPVTDLKWRALGRQWLKEDDGVIELPQEPLLERLGADDLYLTLGLSRRWQGRHWPLVHTVHTIPDYDIAIDLDNL